jgi:comEA protein
MVLQLQKVTLLFQKLLVSSLFNKFEINWNLKISNSIHTRVITYWSLALIALAVTVYGESEKSCVEITVVSNSLEKTDDFPSSKEVKNQDRLMVISPKTKKIDAPQSSKKLTGSSKVLIKLNSAVESDLVKIKGIGPVLAERIVVYRESNGKFTKIDELTRVKGIGPKTLEKIEPFFCLD